MQQFCQYGSVRGATGNRRPYRDDGFCGQPPEPQAPVSKTGQDRSLAVTLQFVAQLFQVSPLISRQAFR